MKEAPIFDFIENSTIYTKALTLANHGKAAPYERLEFLGDRVLGLILADKLYHQFKKENEGDWAMRFTILAQEKTLAAVARNIGIPALLQTKDDYLRDNDSILSDVCEAIIAAIYLDKGLPTAYKFVEKFWAPFFNQDHQTIKDSKSALQEWAQKYQKMPVYEVLEQTGPDHAPTFTIRVTIDQAGEATATASSKKKAMQEAAAILYEKLTQSTKKKKK